MTLHAPLYPAGTRVTVRQGRLPLPQGVEGRTGTVVGTSDYRPGRYAVLLDGETEPRNFSQDELASTGG